MARTYSRKSPTFPSGKQLVTMKHSLIIALAFLLTSNFSFAQQLKRMRTLKKGTIDIIGVALEGKWCGMLRSRDSTLYYLEDDRHWDEKYVNKKVRITGDLILEKRWYKEQKDEKGEIIYSAVLPERMLIIVDPSISLE